MSYPTSPALDGKRKRKKLQESPCGSVSKKPRECVSSPTTPKQKQLSMETFLVTRQSSPLSNIGNSMRPRELIPPRNTKALCVVSIDGNKDDCQVLEPKISAPSQSCRKLHLSESELIKAARLAVSNFYKRQTIESDVEIILDEVTRRSLMCEGYAMLFRKEVQENRYKFALLLLEANITSSQYPSATVLHTLLATIIPKADSFDIKSLAFELLHKVLEKHPPDSDEMKDVYWSILPKKLANSDPSSRWENLRSHLENLDRDTSTLEIENLSEEHPFSSVREDEAFLQYYITVLEKDLLCWLERHSTDYIATLAAKKDVPMAAMLFWPYEAFATPSKNVKELFLFHKNALVQQNEQLLSVTSKLLDILIEVTHLSESPPPVKVRVAGPKLRSLASALCDIFYRGEEAVDLSFLFATFKDALFKFELSKAFLGIYEPRRGKLSDLREILQVYLKLDRIKNASDLTAAFEKLSCNGKTCLVTLVESYLSSFHVIRLWNLIRQSKKTSGFEVSADGDKYFSSSYSAADLLKDFRTLQSVVKLGKGSKVISNVFHM